MRVLKIGTIVGLALAVTACGPRDRDTAVTMDDPALGGPAPVTTEQPGMPGMPGMPAGAMSSNLEAVAGSGVMGEVAVTPRNGRTDVMMMVRGGPPNESLGARIHSGTCESPGVEIARLDAVRTDAAGQGQSQTDVGHAPHLILDGNHIAAVFAPGAQPERDQPIACSTLPEHGSAGTMPGTTRP